MRAVQIVLWGTTACASGDPAEHTGDTGGGDLPRDTAAPADSDDTSDSPAVDCDQVPEHPDCADREYAYTLDWGGAVWRQTVDDVVTCNYSFNLTGTEYRSADCPDCDFSFAIDATSVSPDDQGPKCDDRYPFTFPVTDTSYGAMPTGLAFVADGDVHLPRYGDYHATEVLGAFAALEYGNTNYMMRFEPLAGTLSNNYFIFSFDAGLVSPGAGAGTTGHTSLEYHRSFASGRADTLVYCPGVESLSEDPAWQRNPPIETVPKVTAPTLSAEGRIGCAGPRNAEVDTFKVSVAPGSLLHASLDTHFGGHFDGRLWVADQYGCVVHEADDQFDCSPGACSLWGSTYMCCPAVSFRNETGALQEYTIHVGSLTNSCQPGTDPSGGLYTLGLTGATSLTPDKDGYLPQIEQAFRVDLTVSRTPR